MKNKLTDLNDHLFAQLERLGNENLSGEALNNEIERSKAISNIATQTINNASLVLRAEELKLEYGHGVTKLPKMLEGS